MSGINRELVKPLLFLIYLIPIDLWRLFAYRLSCKMIRIILLWFIIVSGVTYFSSNHSLDILKFSVSAAMTYCFVISPHFSRTKRAREIDELRREKISAVDDAIFCFFYSMTFLQIISPLYEDYYTWALLR